MRSHCEQPTNPCPEPTRRSAWAARDDARGLRRARAAARLAAVAVLAAALGAVPAALAAEQEALPPADPIAYVIGVGDVLKVSVWRNAELSVTVPVRPDGQISVPLLGDVMLAGLSPAAAQQLLIDGFSAYVTAPAVSVIVQEINSRKVFITGEVAKPGAYDLLQPTRLMQALALAGGLTPYAKDQLIVLRQTPEGQRRFEVSVKNITGGRQMGDNLDLQPGDTIIVP